MLPETYMKEKQKIEENLEILKIIDDKNDIYTYILEFQKNFIEGVKTKIDNVQTRSDVSNI